MENVEQFMGDIVKLEAEIRDHAAHFAKNKYPVSVASVYYSMDLGNVQINIWTATDAASAGKQAQYKTLKVKVDRIGEPWSINLSKNAVGLVLEKYGFKISGKTNADEHMATSVYLKLSAAA